MTMFVEAFINELVKLGYNPKGHPRWKEFKKNKVALTPEERALVMKRKAVGHFHHGRDGKKLSVVGGQGLYSEPREIAPVSGYSRMEVGILPGLASPKSVGFDEALCDQFELEDESGGVAGYVPVEVIREMALALANSQKEG